MQRQDRQALLDNAGSFRAACTFSLRHRLWQTHFFYRPRIIPFVSRFRDLSHLINLLLIMYYTGCYNCPAGNVEHQCVKLL